jgi:hypothetical protein
LCYYQATLPAPLLTSTEDIVVESHWPHPGKYSLVFGKISMPNESISVTLNNGHAYFAATPAVRDFNRHVMGWVVGETFRDFGFAQTAFMKLMSYTALEVK